MQHMGQPDTAPAAAFGENPAPSQRAAMVLHTAKGKMRLYPTRSIRHSCIGMLFVQMLQQFMHGTVVSRRGSNNMGFLQINVVKMQESEVIFHKRPIQEV